MKRAIITDEVSQDFAKVLRFAQDLALEGVEIRSVANQPLHHLDDRQVEDIRTMAASSGIVICGVASPVFKCDIENRAEVDEQIDILKRCMELAEAWAAPMIRVFTGWRRTYNRELLPKVAAMFRQKVIPLIENKPYYLGVENEFSTNMATGEESCLLLDCADSANIRLVWDPCNILFLEEATDPFQDHYPAVRRRVAHLHVKDAVRVEGQEVRGEAVRLGDGVARLKETLQALAHDGYNGWISLETHWRLERQLSEAVTRSPMGEAFSATAEEASRICMTRLNGWLKHVDD